MEGKKVYAAIQAVSKAMAAKGISKDDTNSFHKYKFRGIDAVMKALSVELIAANLLLLPRLTESREISTSGGGKTTVHVFITMEYDLVSTEDGSSRTIAFPGEGADNGDKSSNKAMSAAYKYAVLQTFCIPTEGVLDDSDAGEPEEKAQPVDVPALQKLVDKCKTPEELRALWATWSKAQQNELTDCVGIRNQELENNNG